MLVIMLILAAFTIVNPKSFEGDVLIKEVQLNSSAADAGMKAGELIKSINNVQIKSLQDYTAEISSMNLSEEEIKMTIVTDKQEYIFMTDEDLGIIPAAVSKTRLKTGLDLQGGARALVLPERELTSDEMESLLETVRNRLSVYGLTDLTVKEVSDLEGNHYMLIEMAGATPAELNELVGKQGKFEAKIGEQIVFFGGKNDIPSVCRNDATCAYIEECSSLADGEEACRFKFQIQLSPEAAALQASTTANLSENVSESGRWLNETLDLYLDDILVESLRIDADLKGKPATTIVIEGSGIGSTREEAYYAAQKEMKRLQTILITGSLPFKLEIVKLDSVSPVLGKEFAKNVIVAGIIVFLTVCLIIYIRYRRPVLFIPVMITMVSEAVLVLFFMALFKEWWTLDLSAIAGIIAAIGTGVDDQIVMIDESKSSTQHSFKERIKRAFTIIFSAYAVTAVALIPLWWAGTGLLRGFAISTLLGITVGVLITRPAFAEILKAVTKE